MFFFFLVGADEVEIGMGIHNESGILKQKLTTSKELITQMLAYVTDTTDEERAFLPFKHDGKDEVVLLVNNLYVTTPRREEEGSH